MSRERQPWDRQTPDETQKQYEAFRYYLALREGRKLDAVADHLGVNVSLIRAWSAKNKWRARAAEWDDHMSQIRLDAEEKVEARNAELWKERKLRIAEANWTRAIKLGEWADEALAKMPLFEQEIEQVQLVPQHDEQTGKTIQVPIPTKVIIKPVKWNATSLFDAFKTAALLAATAITEATQSFDDDDGFDPEKATPEETRAWLAKKSKRLPGA